MVSLTSVLSGGKITSAKAKPTEVKFSAALLEVLLSELMIDGGRLSQSFIVDQQSSLYSSKSDVEDRLS